MTSFRYVPYVAWIACVALAGYLAYKPRRSQKQDLSLRRMFAIGGDISLLWRCCYESEPIIVTRRDSCCIYGVIHSAPGWADAKTRRILIQVMYTVMVTPYEARIVSTPASAWLMRDTARHNCGVTTVGAYTKRRQADLQPLLAEEKDLGVDREVCWVERELIPFQNFEPGGALSGCS